MSCCTMPPLSAGDVPVAPAERAKSNCAHLAVLLLSWLLLLAGSSALAQENSTKMPNWRGRVDYWQPQWMQRELWGPGRMPKGLQVRMLRHWTYVNHGVPKAYAGAQSTITPSSKELLAGAQLYTDHCAGCHGAKGLGDGKASLSLMPSPALLAYMIKRPISADEYLMWSIADGGTSLQTAMPAFKDKLSKEDIWRIVAYMRNGFSADGK